MKPRQRNRAKQSRALVTAEVKARLSRQDRSHDNPRSECTEQEPMYGYGVRSEGFECIGSQLRSGQEGNSGWHSPSKQ